MFCQSKGTILRIEEGQTHAVLCTADGEAPTCSGYQRQDSNISDGYDDCKDLSSPIQGSNFTSFAHQTSEDMSTLDIESDQELCSDSEDIECRSSPAGTDPFSDVGDASATEVVFVKEGVAVWPTRAERIMGRLSLVKQHCVMFLAWLPYSRGSVLEDGTFQVTTTKERTDNLDKDRTMYAVHPIPLSEIKAITKHTPTLGWHYIVIVLNNGVTLPPLYFHNGGVRSLIGVLKQHAFLAKSSHDPNTYLVNDTADPLQRSLTSLELTDILLGAPPPGASSTFVPPPAWNWAESTVDPSWRSFSANLGETLTKLTQCVKDTTCTWFGAAEFVPSGRHSDPSLALTCKSLNPTDFSAGPSALVAMEGEDILCSAKRRRSSGFEASSSLGEFELVETCMEDAISNSRRRIRPPPLSREEWNTMFDAEGRLVNDSAFRERVFYSGVEPELRREAWKFLLGLYKADSTASERRQLVRERRTEYETLRRQWTSITEQQASRFAKWQERKSRVDKDVRRTDRSLPFFAKEHSPNLKALRNILLTYTMFNFDLGYCQGMSDLASPLLYVMRDEAEAFWCFAALMDRLEGNFHTDQRGMHSQLLALQKLVRVLDPQLHAFLEAKDCLNYFFCFRWVLIHFKREFKFDEMLRLWEAYWSCPLTKHLYLYMCVAVLVHHRRAIIEGDMEFDTLLKFCVELSGKLDMDQLLRLSEALCLYAGEAGNDCFAGLP